MHFDTNEIKKYTCLLWTDEFLSCPFCNNMDVIFPLRSAPSSPEISPQSSPRPPRANNDRLTLLTRLVRKGEKKGLFVEKMPAWIYQVLHYHNPLPAAAQIQIPGNILYCF